MRPLEEELLVRLLWHPASRALHARVRAAIEGEWDRASLTLDRNRDRVLAAADGHAFDGRLQGRLETFHRLGDLSQCRVGDLLTDELAARAHTEEHRSAVAVQERAERLESLTELARRLLELDAGTLAGAHELLQLAEIHRVTFP